jgi:hypothetical protein
MTNPNNWEKRKHDYVRSFKRQFNETVYGRLLPLIVFLQIPQKEQKKNAHSNNNVGQGYQGVFRFESFLFLSFGNR